jgi:hypothetical protein
LEQHFVVSDINPYAQLWLEVYVEDLLQWYLQHSRKRVQRYEERVM